MPFNMFELFEQPQAFETQEGLNSDSAESFLWLWPGAQGADHPVLISQFKVSQIRQVV